jgi:pimeloyl-ACP methyl ester carboxylesterase
MWEEHAAEVAGRRLAWRRGGSGPPLLHLHDAGADTLDSPALADLAGDHDVVVLDLPGYGRSGPPTDLPDAAAVADVLAALLDHLGWPAAGVLGTSLGGWFALELALAHPSRVAALVVCDAAGLHLPSDYLFALFAEGRAAERTEELIRRSLLRHLPPDEREPDAMAPALAAATMAPFVQTLAAAALTSWSPGTANPALLGRLGGITCPTVILWGEHDALIPLAHGRLLSEAIPGAVLVVITDGGHLPPLERPEVVAAAVRGCADRAGGRIAYPPPACPSSG